MADSTMTWGIRTKCFRKKCSFFKLEKNRSLQNGIHSTVNYMSQFSNNIKALPCLSFLTISKLFLQSIASQVILNYTWSIHIEHTEFLFATESKFIWVLKSNEFIHPTNLTIYLKEETIHLPQNHKRKH